MSQHESGTRPGFDRLRLALSISLIVAVIKRLEEEAKSDRAVSRRLKALAKEVSSAER